MEVLNLTFLNFKVITAVLFLMLATFAAVCPFGFIQDLLDLIRRKPGMEPLRFSVKLNKRLKCIEKYTGKKITAAMLHSAAIMLDRARHQTRGLYELRELSRPLICGRLDLPILNACGIDMAVNWTGAMEKLNNELEKKTEQPGFQIYALPCICPSFSPMQTGCFAFNRLCRILM